MKLAPLICLLFAACAVGPNAVPNYKPPETRPTAARHLYEALATGASNVSEIRVDELKLNWHERLPLSKTYSELIERELDLLRVREVSRPTKPGEWWELRIDAPGGVVTFTFKDAVSAAKAESAITRLMRPLSDTEAVQFVD